MGKPRAALERLVETGQGIFVLHHALVAYRTWDFWNTVVGIADRREFGYAPDQSLRIEVADPDHPITRGLAAWELTDETYTVNLPGPDSHILLTTEHPKCMRTVAWTREVGKSRRLLPAIRSRQRGVQQPQLPCSSPARHRVAGATLVISRQ